MSEKSKNLLLAGFALDHPIFWKKVHEETFGTKEEISKAAENYKESVKKWVKENTPFSLNFPNHDSYFKQLAEVNIDHFYEERINKAYACWEEMKQRGDTFLHISYGDYHDPEKTYYDSVPGKDEKHEHVYPYFGRFPDFSFIGYTRTPCGNEEALLKRHTQMLQQFKGEEIYYKKWEIYGGITAEVIGYRASYGTDNKGRLQAHEVINAENYAFTFPK